MRRPFLAYLLFLAAFLAVLGWGWLRQTPSNEELLGYAGKFQYFADLIASERRLPWWIPGYLSGFSTVAVLSYAAAMPPFLFAMQFLEPTSAMKITGLVLLGLGGLASFLFGARLTRSGWTAFAIGAAFVLAPQVLMRLGWQEHLTIVAAYPLVPLAFWALLRVAERGSPLDAQLLAMAFSGATLVWTKIGATLVIPLALFALWLFVTRPASRRHLIRGALWALPLTLLLCVIPLLPLLREFRFMTVFELSPFASWQASYSVKTGTSWIDRGGALFGVLPQPLRMDRGGYYLGLAPLLAVAVLMARNWRATRPDDAALLPTLKAFLGFTLVIHWLSLGPRGVLAGHFEFLGSAISLPDWMIPVHWLLLAGQAALVFWLIPRHRLHAAVFTGLLAVYLLVPGFRLLERLPLYSDLRAPDSFWILGGTFSWVVAAGIAVSQCLRLIPAIPARTLVAVLTLAFVVWDASAYARYFFRGGLSPALYADYAGALRYLRDSPLPGRVLPISGRYFYLTIPAEAGRGLVTEAAHHNFMSREMARLSLASRSSSESFLAAMNVTGVSHVLIDKTDPDSPAAIREWLETLLPKAFENDHFLVLENRSAMPFAFSSDQSAPAAEKYQEYGQALSLARKGALTIAPKPGSIPPPAPTPPGDSPSRALAPVSSLLGQRADEFIIAPGGIKGWLVLSQAYHPDWTAFADGEMREVVRAAGAFPAVALRGNESKVTFRLSPPAWYAPCLVAGISGWIASLGLLAFLPFFPGSFRRYWCGRTATPEIISHAAMDRAPIAHPLVIIPTFNESASIRDAIDCSLAALPSTHILVVDDASPDSTAAIVRAHPKFGDSVHLLARSGKLGLGSAYREGFEWAIARHYDACVEMDADLSHDPDDLPSLIAALDAGADAAIGSRYLGGVRVINWPQHRLLLSAGASHYVRILTSLPLADPTSGFKAIRTSALARIPRERLTADGYGFQIELHHLLWTSGFRLVEIPIVFTERRAGMTKMTTAIAFEAAWRVIQLAASGGAPKSGDHRGSKS